MNINRFFLLKIICFVSIYYLSFNSMSYAMDNSECLGCHADKELCRTSEKSVHESHMREILYVDEIKFNNSVHHINGVSCVDCHADITSLNYNENTPHAKKLQPVLCTTCHAEEGEAFIHSVHMKARSKGITMSCYACHDYHYVTLLAGESVAERENGFCLRCHKPFQSHDWLPQKKAHLAFIECTVCHAPAAAHHVHLKFYDLVANAFLSGNDVLRILGIGYNDFLPQTDKNKDGIINNDEIETLFLRLRQKNVHIMFHAELVKEMQPLVHQVLKEGAIKDCQECHAPDSPFFKAVTILLTKEDGTVDHYQVERSVLEGYHTSHFSALGGTRVRLLDKIGLAMIVGGMVVVLLHLSARLITIPVRRHAMAGRKKTQMGNKEKS